MHLGMRHTVDAIIKAYILRGANMDEFGREDKKAEAFTWLDAT